jgi:hypothetical protein
VSPSIALREHLAAAMYVAENPNGSWASVSEKGRRPFFVLADAVFNSGLVTLTTSPEETES